jgi:hypothetical protein
MAVVVPKINLDGVVFEHVTILEPRDFIFWSVPSKMNWVATKEGHANVGTLDQIREQFDTERQALFGPMADSIENMLIKSNADWHRDRDLGPYCQKLVANSCWSSWELKVSLSGTYELVLGCAWAEAPKLWASDFWSPDHTFIPWTTLWEETPWQA